MRLAALVVGAFVLVAAQAAAKEPGAPKTVFGIAWNLRETSFAKLDALTLERVSKQVPLGIAAFYLGSSPGGGGRAAFAVGESGDAIVFVDLQRMQREGRVALPCGVTTPIVWTNARRLILTCGGPASSVLVVDPVARKLRARHAIRGELMNVERSGSLLVGVTAPLGTIGTARVVMVDDEARVRSVALPGIRAGTSVRDQNTSHFHTEMPALAVTSRYAAVIPAQGAIALVDLNTLAVSLHATSARATAATRKNVDGYQRAAVWTLGNVIAVSGRDWSAGDNDLGTPAGLMLIDADAWTQSLVDRQTSAVAYNGGALLAWSAVWDGGAGRNVGDGFAGYDTNGVRRFHILAGEAVNVAAVVGSYTYLASNDFMHFRVVDTRTGGVIARPRTLRSTTLSAG